MVAYPITLPQQALVDGFNLKAKAQNIRTQMESGPSKVRRRFTKKISNFKITQRLTAAQFDILETFYDTTLQGGSLSFTFTHPINGTTLTLRFTEELDYRADGPINFIVSMALETI
jgi:hypothetical protein